MSEPTDPDDGRTVLPWRPPAVDRADAVAAARDVAPGGVVAALLGAGEAGGAAGSPRRRWHEANDVGGLTALLGGRRPVRPADGPIDASFDRSPDGRGASGTRDASDSPDPPGEVSRPFSADAFGGPPPDAGPARAAAAEDEPGAYEAGFAAGREAAADELAGLARALRRETTIAADALEAELVALARAVAACAMRRELLGDPGRLADLVREALGALDAFEPDAPATVRLNPVDAAMLDGRLGPDVRVVADASMPRAECRVERGAARVDAGVLARLDALGLDADADADADTDADADADADAEFDVGVDIDAGPDDDGRGDGDDGASHGPSRETHRDAGSAPDDDARGVNAGRDA